MKEKNINGEKETSKETPKKEGILVSKDKSIHPDEKNVDNKPEVENPQAESEPTEGIENSKETPLEKSATDKNNAEDIVDKIDENKDGIISSREVVNSIDPENSISEPTAEEILVRTVEKQIEEKSKYFVLRIKKTSFLLITGALILGLWMIPVSAFLSKRFNFSISSFFVKEKTITQEPTPEPTAEIIEASNSAKIDLIRIKTVEETESVKNMQILLKNSGYDAEILVTDDIEEKGTTVAAKSDKVDLLVKLVNLLKDDYFAASSSSQVTTDSDFSAVVMVGK